MVHEAAKEVAGKGAVVQIDTQENPQLAARFGISGIPTVVLLKRGRETARESGFMTKEMLLGWWRRQ